MNVIYILTTNHWALFALFSVIVMVIVGLRQYDVRHLKLHRRYGWKRFRFWAIALSVVFYLLVIVESGSGLVQLSDDNAIGMFDLNEWSILLMLLAAMAAAGVLALILYLVGKGVGEYSKRVTLDLRLSSATKDSDDE